MDLIVRDRNISDGAAEVDPVSGGLPNAADIEPVDGDVLACAGHINTVGAVGGDAFCTTRAFSGDGCEICTDGEAGRIVLNNYPVEQDDFEVRLVD